MVRKERQSCDCDVIPVGSTKTYQFFLTSPSRYLTHGQRRAPSCHELDPTADFTLDARQLHTCQ